MKAVHIHGGSPTPEQGQQTRRVPSGLDKSWESRRVEGLEMMVTSAEQQKEKHKRHCKSASCSHNNNNTTSSSNNNNVQAVDASCLYVGNHHHHGKCRSLSSSKKNKLSTSSVPQKLCLFDGTTQVEGSTFGRRQKIVHADINQNMSPDSFRVRELEQQVLDLIHQLAQEKHQARQDKLSLAKLQQQLARNKSEKPVKEMLMKELEQEKRRREVLEQKFKERSNAECCCCQNEMMVLKKENTRLNEVVQDLLPFKNKVEKMKQSSASSAALLESELHRLRSKLESMEQDNMLSNMELNKLESIINSCQQCKKQLVGQIRLDSNTHSETASITSTGANNETDKTKVLLERLKSLEAEKTALVLENEAQFQHYEKCLEDVTSQILQALVAQRSLKEECCKLKEEVGTLREENSMLKKFLPTNLHGRIENQSNWLPSLEKRCPSKEFQPINRSNGPQTERQQLSAGSRSFDAAAERASRQFGSCESPEDDAADGGGTGEREICGGRSSSLSLNEILDSETGGLGGSSSSNTDGEDGGSKTSRNLFAPFSETSPVKNTRSLFFSSGSASRTVTVRNGGDVGRSRYLDDGATRSEISNLSPTVKGTFGHLIASPVDVSDSRREVKSCTYSTGRQQDLIVTEPGRSHPGSLDCQRTAVTQPQLPSEFCDGSSLSNADAATTTTTMNCNDNNNKPVFSGTVKKSPRGVGSLCNKLLAAATAATTAAKSTAASPSLRDERDDGYSSNKTSEGSGGDVGNVFIQPNQLS